MSIALPRREAFSSRLRGDERGAVAASLIILPAVIFAILMAIHLSLVLHGRNVAAGAAQDALHASQRFGATEADGYNAADRTLDLFAGIESPSVHVVKDTNSDLVTVTVQGTVATPLNGFFNSFDITVSGPIERFYLESERQ